MAESCEAFEERPPPHNPEAFVCAPSAPPSAETIPDPKAQSQLLHRGIVKNTEKIDDIYFTFKAGRTTALISAVERKDEEVVRLLVKSGAQVDKQLLGCCLSGSTALMKAVECDFLSAVQILLEGRANPNIRRKKDIDALLIATDKGLQQITICLADFGADVKVQCCKRWTPLMVWVDREECQVVQALVRNGANPNDEYTDPSETTIIRAVKKESPMLVQALCASGTANVALNVDMQGGGGNTALMHTVKIQCRDAAVEIAGHLLQAKAEVDRFRFQRESNRTPLMVAAASDHNNLVRLLLEHNAQTELQDDEGLTALMVTVDNLALSTLLVNHGANTNVRFGDKSTVLIRAVQKADSELVSLYLKAGAEADLVDDKGRCAVSYAVMSLHVPTLELLIEANACVDCITSVDDGTTALMHGVDKANEQVTARLLQGKQGEASVNRQDKQLWTALMMAVRCCSPALVALLLEAGASTSLRNELGRTALIISALVHEERGSADSRRSLELLLQFSASVSDQDDKRLSTMMIIARKGDGDTLTLLLDSQQGVDVDAQDVHGATALMWAVSGGQLATARLLLEHGATLDILDNDKKSPLIRATRCVGTGSAHIVKMLLEGKADANFSGGHGMPHSLLEAVSFGSSEIAALLIEYSANVNVQSGDGSTPLILAVSRNDARMVDLLLRSDADIDITIGPGGLSAVMVAVAIEAAQPLAVKLVRAGAHLEGKYEDGATPLIRAVQGQHRETVEALLEAKANVRAMDPYRKTALLCAAENNNADLVRHVIGAKADPDTADVASETALMKAVKKNSDVVVRLLMSGGCNTSVRNDQNQDACDMAMQLYGIDEGNPLAERIDPGKVARERARIAELRRMEEERRRSEEREAEEERRRSEERERHVEAMAVQREMHDARLSSAEQLHRVQMRADQQIMEAERRTLVQQQERRPNKIVVCQQNNVQFRSHRGGNRVHPVG